MVSFQDGLTDHPIRLDGLRPLKLVRPHFDEALDVLTREGELQRPEPSARRGQARITAQQVGAAVMIRVEGLDPEQITVCPAEEGEEAAIPTQWPPIIDLREVDDWQLAKAIAAPTTWSDAYEQLHHAIRSQRT